MGIYSFGAIINIHTFSRDIDWNPHIHALITLGGFNKSNNWKTLKKFSWFHLKKSWQKLTLDIIYKVAKSNNNTYLKNNISLAYRKYPKGFYVNANSKVNNSFELGKYLGRYLARPAIAEYRITKVTDSSVTFWFEKPDSNSKEEMTLPISKFIGRLISHIPPKHFKMIRRYGLYARHTKNKIPKKIKLFKVKTSWAERIYKSFGISPNICPKCKIPLSLLEIYHINYGVIYPKPNSS